MSECKIAFAHPFAFDLLLLLSVKIADRYATFKLLLQFWEKSGIMQLYEDAFLRSKCGEHFCSTL